MLKSKGLFFECLPDDPKLCKDPVILKQNKSRLKFYERYGARPIINTKYEMPVKEGDDNPPYLVVDTLSENRFFSKDEMRKIVRAILERKYADVCSKQYVNSVVDSITDNPVQYRPFKYISSKEPVRVKRSVPADKLISLVYNDSHTIHHVREKGYVESPVRIKVILDSIKKTDIFDFNDVTPKHFSEQHIAAVHDHGFVSYLRKVCSIIPETESVYPYVFPIRNNARPPKELPMRAGYYCIDTFTPLNKNAYLAARRAVDCAISGAQKILSGRILIVCAGSPTRSSC